MSDVVDDIEIVQSTREETITKNFYYGWKETSNLVVVLGESPNDTQFHVHWEVLASASEVFEKMKGSRRKEAVENRVVLINDSEETWKALLTKLYPPHDLTFSNAVLIIPLVERFGLTWLLPELARVFSNPAKRAERRPEFADVICSHGLTRMVAQWFEKRGSDNNWALKEHATFIEECQHADAVRYAAECLAATVKSGLSKLTGSTENKCHHCRYGNSLWLAQRLEECGLLNLK